MRSHFINKKHISLHRNIFFRICLLIAITLLTFPLIETAFAQDTKKLPAPKQNKTASATHSESKRQQAPQYDFIEVKEYITKINDAAEPKPRGEFETKEEYDARQPKPIGDAPSLLLIERGYKNYSYDIEKKILTIQIPVSKSKRPDKNLNGWPLQAANIIEKKESYTASNSYGAKVIVEKTWAINYLLFVSTTQLDSILTETLNPILATYPESMRSQFSELFTDRAIHVQIAAEPRDAEKISQNYSILLKVRPKGLQFSVFEATQTTKPTFKEPKELTIFTRGIEVDLIEIIVRDGPMGSELLKKTIGATSTSISK